MLTRFVKTQLVIFTVASIVGVAVMVFGYMQLPTLLGVGRLTVSLDLPATGGLYRFSNVTYNGVQVGRVTGVELTDTGARATLSLDRTPRIPVDLTAHVLSVSAVGEQYVDLRPNTGSGPYLENGAVIAADDTTIPQEVGPMLDRMSALVQSIPKDRLNDLLGETYQAFDGAGYDFQSLVDSAGKLTRDADSVSGEMRSLIDNGVPLLDTQVQTTDAIRTWSRSLAGITGQVVANDPQIRTLLQRGPGFAQEVSGLLTDIKPTLPVLLANMTTVGQILLTYNPAVEQLLVLLPNYIASQQSFGLPKNNATGLPMGDFTLTVGDPNPCTVGFLPPSQWRSPADTTTIDTPDNLYCKLPQDSPVSVRGARNIPCMEHPGKRAPTVELCNDPRGFVPMALRQHITGPAPFDPNLIAQGIPPDDRTTFEEQIHAPIEGTALPPGAVPSGAPPGGPSGPPPPPVFAPQDPAPVPAQPYIPPPPAGNSVNGVPVPPVVPPAGALPVAPSGTAGTGPSVAVVPYDPNTGRYMTPDGRYEQQTDLIAGGAPKSWQDLMPT